MKNLLALCICLTFVLNGYTQNLKVLDSLHIVYQAAQHHTSKIMLLNSLAYEYINGKPDTSILIAELALQLSQSKGFDKGTGWAWRTLGSAEVYKGNYSIALKHFQEGLTILEAINDKQGIAKTLSNIGSVYDVQGNYPLALEYAQRSLKISNEIADRKGIATSLHDIGIIYRIQGNDNLALAYYQKSLIISEEIGDKKGIAMTLNLMGNIYRTQGKNTLALDHYQKSLKLHEELSNKQGVARGWHNLGHIFSNQKDFSKAIAHYEQSLNLRQEIGDKHAIPSSFNALAQVYYKQKEYDKAINYAASVMKLHKIHPMNATRLECIILVKLLWVMLNWTFLNHLKNLTQMDLSFHKLANTLQGRSKILTLPVLQNSSLLIEWLTDLYWISKEFHDKEYKKGRKKVSEILVQTCTNMTVNQ